MRCFNVTPFARLVWEHRSPASESQGAQGNEEVHVEEPNVGSVLPASIHG